MVLFTVFMRYMSNAFRKMANNSSSEEVLVTFYSLLDDKHFSPVMLCNSINVVVKELQLDWRLRSM